MKKNYTVQMAIIIAAVILCGALDAEAVPNPGAISWRGSPTAFVTSLYVGVLGRQPESQAVVNGWAAQVNATPHSRYQVFWRFVNSPEYQGSRWAKQRREYTVYRKYYIKSDIYKYSVSKGPLGADYYPHAGPYTFGVAMALRGYFEAFFTRR
ncbi:MAG: DUF4214 domain-containing protein [Syntrophorhabdaceae bacterium]|nr:DUF4214 domain-containing protein [Syntrophorhabdaceae bacterium]